MIPGPADERSTDVTAATDVVVGLREAGWRVATAESLTGGLLAADLTAVPGASVVVVGGVVSYDTAVKATILGVDADLLRRRGAVDPEVALQMAHGVRRVLGADVGVATTGAAGPDPAPGGTEMAEVSPGTAYVAVVTPAASRVEHLAAPASGEAPRDADPVAARERVRRMVVAAALRLTREALTGA